MGKRLDDHDYDDADDDIPVSRRRTKSRSGLTKLLAVVAMVAWGLLLMAIGCGGLLFIWTLKEANGAPQEAAAGAIFSTTFIGLYVIVRCIEKLAVAVERLQSK